MPGRLPSSQLCRSQPQARSASTAGPCAYRILEALRRQQLASAGRPPVQAPTAPPGRQAARIPTNTVGPHPQAAGRGPHRWTKSPPTLRPSEHACRAQGPAQPLAAAGPQAATTLLPATALQAGLSPARALAATGHRGWDRPLNVAGPRAAEPYAAQGCRHSIPYIRRPGSEASWMP